MSRISTGQAQNFLDEHNCARARYNAGPLQWSWKLAADAQIHADRCGFWHSTNIGKLPSGQGENLSISMGSSVGTRGWLQEEGNYDCAEGKCKRGQCGHWTQMIWNDTEQVGCAIQRCASTVKADGSPDTWRNAELLVCRYGPPGNYRGQAAVSKPQCAAGAAAGNCGDTSRFPRVPEDGRGVGVIVGKGVAATQGAGASASNESGLKVLRVKDAPVLTNAKTISGLAKRDGSEIFPDAESKAIASQYEPADVQFFLDQIAPTPEKLEQATVDTIVATMAAIEQRRQERGTIYVRFDQRKLLDGLPPQHLTPLLTLLRGVPTFQHAMLLDRFFSQLELGKQQKLGGSTAAAITDKAGVSTSTTVVPEGELKDTLKKDDPAAVDSEFNFDLLDDAEELLGNVIEDKGARDDAKAVSQAAQAKIAAGKADVAEVITTAYVEDAVKVEEAAAFSSLQTLLLLVGGIFMTALLSVVGYLVYQKIKHGREVFGSNGILSGWYWSAIGALPTKVAWSSSSSSSSALPKSTNLSAGGNSTTED